MFKLNILFYTDYNDREYPDKNFCFEYHNRPHPLPFGLTMLRDLIIKNQPVNADIYINLVNRNSSPDGSIKRITRELLQDVHELWIFGYYTKNQQYWSTLEGGPYNELDNQEITVLREWMNKRRGEGGGLFVAGDHTDVKGDSLGRALGESIPLAGKMRVWNGGPTVDRNSSFNTQVPGRGFNREDRNLQKDEFPQNIDLIDIEENGENYARDLFYFDNRDIIAILPDHIHEGELVPPDAIKDWPAQYHRPVIVALGRDNRIDAPKSVAPLISVFDGKTKNPAINVGRIVVDTSWHHYTNINLIGLLKEDLNKIGRYYGNLVRWLAPQAIRDSLSHDLFKWLAKHPTVAVEIEQDSFAIINAIDSVLKYECQPIEEKEMYKLLATIDPAFTKFPDQIKKLFLAGIVLTFYLVEREIINKNSAELNRSDIDFDNFNQSCIKLGFRYIDRLFATGESSFPRLSENGSGSVELVLSKSNRKEKSMTRVFDNIWGIESGYDPRGTTIEVITFNELYGMVIVRHTFNGDTFSTIGFVTDSGAAGGLGSEIAFTIRVADGSDRAYRGKITEIGGAVDRIQGKVRSTFTFLAEDGDYRDKEKEKLELLQDDGWMGTRPPT